MAVSFRVSRSPADECRAEGFQADEVDLDRRRKTNDKFRESTSPDDRKTVKGIL